MTNSIKSIKFIGMTQEVQDAVLWVDDIEMDIRNLGISDALDQVMTRVISGDLKAVSSVHVIDDNKELATNMANVLNAQFEKEMVLMKEANIAKQEVNQAIEGQITVNKKEKAAAEFLAKHSAKMKNAQKGPVASKQTTTQTEGETTMTTKTTMGRRQLKSTEVSKSTVQETTNNVVVNEETKGSRRRLASGSGSKVEMSTNAPRGTQRRLARSESINSSTFVKHEGPWYLNASLYPVLERFESILENMADAELGIEEIALVEPTDIYRYAKKEDVFVVIQIKANGTVLDFPIKEQLSSNSKSDLTSTSIGWVEYGGKVKPRFGFYRSNAPVINTTCACGGELKGSSSTNIYCHKCKTRQEDAVITIKHSKLAMEVEEVVFQTIPNMYVSAEILALVMAIAQYDAGFDMHGVVAE